MKGAGCKLREAHHGRVVLGKGRQLRGVGIGIQHGIGQCCVCVYTWCNTPHQGMVQPGHRKSWDSWVLS